MASSTQPQFTAVVSGNPEGSDFISFTWPVLTPIIGKEFRVDLVAGVNVIPFDLSAADPAPQMVIIKPPVGNNKQIEYGPNSIHKNNPTVISLDPDFPATEIELDAADEILGVRIIIL